MYDNLVEMTVWCVALICGTVLVATHHSDFNGVLVGLFVAVTARGVRGAIKPREVVKQLQDEHEREKSGLKTLPPEDAHVR